MARRQAVVVAVAAALLQVAHAAFTPNLFFNWTFDARDVAIQWRPDYEYTAGVDNTVFTRPWNLTFDQSSMASYVRGQAGLGPAHRVATDVPENPSAYQYPVIQLGDVQVSNVYLGGEVFNKGDAKALTINGIVDTQTVPLTRTTQSQWIGSLSTSYGAHNIGIMLANGTWRIDSVVVTMGIQSQAPSWDDVPFTEEPFIKDSSLNRVFSYTGSWVIGNSIGGVGGQSPQPMSYISGSQVTETVRITIPANTALFVLDGLMGPDNGILGIDFNPNPPVAYNEFVYCTAVWVSNCTLAVQTLDPSINYTVTLSWGDAISGMNNRSVGLTNVKFYSGLYGNGHNGSGTAAPKSKSSNAAAIGGGVGGGVGGLLLIGLLAFCWWKKRKPAKADNDSTFEIDEPIIAVEPFGAHNASTAPNASAPGHETMGYQNSATSVPMSERKQRNAVQQWATSGVAPAAAGSSSSGMPPASESSSSANMSGYKHPFTPPPVARPASFTQEVDAGAVPEEEEPETELIPPSYNPMWRPPADTAASSSTAAPSNSGGGGSSHSAGPSHSPSAHGARPLPQTPGASH